MIQFLVFYIKALRILSLKWNVHSNWWDHVINVWQMKVLPVFWYEDMWCTDTCARSDLAMRLKCAIMVMYDSEEFGSCCEMHWTHLTNGLDILPFPSLIWHPTSVPVMAAAAAAVAAVEVVNHWSLRLPTKRNSYNWLFTKNKEVKGTSVQNITTPCKEKLLQSFSGFKGGTVKKKKKRSVLLFTPVPLFLIGFKKAYTL